MSVEVFRATPPPRAYRAELLPDDAMTSALHLLERPGDAVPEVLEAAVGRGLERALAFAAAHAAEQRTALVFLSEISPLPYREMELRLAERRPRFRSTELCRLLFDRCAEEVHRDPIRALELARLARRAADLLEDPPAAIRNDVKAGAWAVTADVRRLAGDPRRAEKALASARHHLRTGSGTLMVRADLLIKQAALECDLDRFDHGQRAVDQALCILRAGARRTEVARALVARGRLYLESGRSEAALPLFEEALELADDGADRALVTAAQHNLAAGLCELGRFDEARHPLAAATCTAKLLSRPLSVLHLQWLEGRRAEALGDAATAEAAYTKAVEGFRARRLRPAAARAALELARFRWRHRRSGSRLTRSLLTATRHGKEAWRRRPITDRSW